VRRALYLDLARMMGDWLAKPMPRLYRPSGLVPAAGVAVYVGLRPDRSVDYVGSVFRPNDPSGLAARIREHQGVRKWAYIVVFPLVVTTPQDVVRRLEGTVGRITRPKRNRRLPSVPFLFG
jgi:hypothetical protein